MKKEYKWYAALHFVLMIYSSSAVLSKMAAGQDTFSIKWMLLYGGAVCLLGMYALGWQQIIKHINIATAYSNKAVTVMWGMLFGRLLFNESVDMKQIIGAIVIVVGIIWFTHEDKGDSNE